MFHTLNTLRLSLFGDIRTVSPHVFPEFLFC